ncbi:hypothetical protein O181_031248 [Austropuccinia psidii MF-1]|uniref:Uncharacterized protein n=1 Tax=Austropuccinia psidii MF-1 TaxID=1389203 RepID=A0A9Q3CZA2_9BASI|nr:hypothetical protein [Austropuccinia psidii MF-1]
MGFKCQKKPTKSPLTTFSHSPHALKINSAATHSRPKWHPMIREPSQHNEPPIHTPIPPIPGLSEVPASQVPPTENGTTCEPEPEGALTKKISLTPPSSISGSSCQSALIHHHQCYACQIPPSPGAFL